MAARVAFQNISVQISNSGFRIDLPILLHSFTVLPSSLLLICRWLLQYIDRKSIDDLLQ
jgi:hypothetical protein